MKHTYNYNSYTTKPIVNSYVPFIDVESLKNTKIEENNQQKRTYTIEELAEIIVSNNEVKRGDKYPSQERRRYKKQVIKDIKKGKYKINIS